MSGTPADSGGGSLSTLLNFLFALEREGVHFTLGCYTNALMVIVRTPSHYYEIEFFENGRVDVQTFGPASAIRTMTPEQIEAELVNGTGNSDG